MITSNWLRVSITLITVCSIYIFSVPNVQAVSYPGITGNSKDEWITSVTFGEIHNTTGRENDGYGNYTFSKAAMMTDVVSGGTYDLRVVISPDKKYCEEYVSAFFDWNRNGRFTDSGEELIIATDSCVAGPHNVNVKVPANAVAGEIRMRIVLHYGEAPKSTGIMDHGEAEDYSVWLLGQGRYKPIFGNNWAEWITKVSFGHIGNATGQELRGYGNYSYGENRVMANVVRDRAYTLSVKIRPGGDEFITAFFDWNHDADFDDEGESITVLSGVNNKGPHSVSVKIPADALPGLTRMRVVMEWGSSPSSSGYIDWGEAEDYTIVVYKDIWGSPVDDWVTNVSLGDISNTSGKETNGYGSYTGQLTSVRLKKRYSLYVRIYSRDASTTKYVSAFFDWNRNGRFSDPGEEVVVCKGWKGQGTRTCGVYVNVPIGAALGKTHMRIVQKSNGQPPSYGYIGPGEAEDYTINIKRRYPWPLFIPKKSDNT